MLRYFTIPPPLSLKNYVKCFWVLEGTASPADPYIHRSMADGGAEILFHYKGRFDEILSDSQITPSFHSGIHAPSSRFTRFTISEDFGMFGAYVYPYALPVLLNMPVHEITNSMNELDLLLETEGREISERMMSAEDNCTRVSILSDYLIRKISRYSNSDQQIEHCIREIIRSKGRTAVDKLASDHYLSSRQFQRRFKNLSGFSPTTFARITRFQASLANFGKGFETLTSLAYDHGYYDQSHFIHDFREFSGFHPKEYFMQINEGNQWKINEEL